MNEENFYIRDITNQEWDIGERIILPVDDITGIQVEATIVDTKTNSIVFWARLQEGLTVRYQGGIWHFDEDIGGMAPLMKLKIVLEITIMG